MWLPIAAIAVPAGATTTLLAESGNGLDLTRYGIAGVIATIAGVVIRWLYQRGSAASDRERAQLIADHADDKTAWAEQIGLERQRADRLEGKLSELNDAVRGQTMKALEEASRAVSDTIAYLRGSGR